MKKIVLFLVVISASFVGFSQGKTHPDSFEIENTNSIKETKKINAVIVNADLESFRLKNQDVILNFEEGYKCVLLSASTLKSMGINIDLSKYQEKFPNGFSVPIFSINNEGYLLAAYKKKTK